MNTRGIKQISLQDRPRLHRLIYGDAKGGKLLYSAKHNLRGKPDFIFQSRITGRLLPMELKSGRADGLPHHGDVMQLAAYFVIIEEAMGKRPRRGYLRYQNALFAIKNSAKRRKELCAILTDMRKMLKTGEGHANPSFAHCRHCAARGTVCDMEP